MSRTQFWILNLVGAVGAALVLAAATVSRLNEHAGRTLNETQEQLNRAQQMQTTAHNLIVRIAQAAQSEAALRELLAKHDLKVDLNPAPPAANP